eukprot:scaffold3990_cov54-Attheya_sp.AAC.3
MDSSSTKRMVDNLQDGNEPERKRPNLPPSSNHEDIIPVGRKQKKRVSFATEEAQVFYFEKNHTEEESGTPQEDNDGSVSQTTCRLTAELTVLSSLHGRARRILRDISKLDLQTAIKYGVKMRGHPDPKTREERWKFVFGNVVYITDSTCTREITSYKEAVNIQPATITPEMLERHDELVRILRDEPQLCTTHSVIIIDQSGSMRAADVNGFRNRSQAAYGTLALDYIAEQLYTRGDDLFVDAISVIEMNDTGNLIISKDPLDWLLFNNLLRRQTEAKPRSHGNYLHSVQLASDIILNEWNLLSSLELDSEDLPAYMLVFLSDGKPSDKTPYETEMRLQIVRFLAQTLGEKLTFCAMGLGAAGSDFHSLSELVANVKAHGAEGTFNHAGLSSTELSSLFSSISSTMTTTRTQLLESNTFSSDKTEKSVTMRKNDTPLKKWPFQRYTVCVSRYRFDIDRYKNYKYAWEQVPFRDEAASCFDIETSPFGRGAERLAYRFHEVKLHQNGGKRVGKMMVAKESKFINDERGKEGFHKNFCTIQQKAGSLADDFNKAIKRCPMLKPTKDECSKPPRITFLKCHVYEYNGNDGILSGLLVESFLKGKFTKYNGNNGYVLKSRSDRSVELEIGEVRLDDFLQAFSHYTYITTDHNLIVCDLQGVLNEEGRYPRFELTDPVICTKKKPRYGKTDLRMRGIRLFCKSHRCNNVCKGLGLPNIGSRK